MIQKRRRYLLAFIGVLITAGLLTLSLILAVGTSRAQTGTGVVEGTVTYYGSLPDPQSIQLSIYTTTEQPLPPPVTTAQTNSVDRAYTLTGLEDGPYYVFAYLDIDSGSDYDPGAEPFAWYDYEGDGRADPVTVQGGTVSDIDILLTDLWQPLGGPFCQPLYDQEPDNGVTAPRYAYLNNESAAIVVSDFYTGTRYPTAYHGALFVADYDKRWIKYLTFENGNAIVHDFLENVSELASTLSTHSEQSQTYAWTFDDGETSTEANPVYTYTIEGTYTAALTVTTPQGKSSSDQIRIFVGQSPPTPIIETPADGNSYVMGTSLAFSDRATNNQGENVPASQLQWNARIFYTNGLPFAAWPDRDAASHESVGQPEAKTLVFKDGSP